MRAKYTRDRETISLIEAMDELNLSSSTIITLDEDSEIKASNRTIRIIPAWKYLLS